MKILRVLLLVAAICLSLCGCFPQKRVVEITMDNWQEYFEHREEDIWETDSSGEISRLHRFGTFALKPEYTNRLKQDEAELNITYTYDWKKQEIAVDWDAKTYALQGKPEYSLPIVPTNPSKTWITDYFSGVCFGHTVFSCSADSKMNPHGTKTVVYALRILEISGYITLME